MLVFSFDPSKLSLVFIKGTTLDLTPSGVSSFVFGSCVDHTRTLAIYSNLQGVITVVRMTTHLSVQKKSSFPALEDLEKSNESGVSPRMALHTYHLRTSLSDIRDTCFLGKEVVNSTIPPIVLMSGCHNKGCKVTVCEVHKNKHGLCEIFSTSIIDDTANMLIPVYNMRGVLVVGMSGVYYRDFSRSSQYTFECTKTFTCWEAVDVEASHYLLATDSGQLWYLRVVADGSDVMLLMSSIDTSCSASSLTCLEKDIVFIGSHIGSPVIVQLNVDFSKAEGLSIISEFIAFRSYSPIIDMHIHKERLNNNYKVFSNHRVYALLILFPDPD